jgi:hypothetical protein
MSSIAEVTWCWTMESFENNNLEVICRCDIIPAFGSRNWGKSRIPQWRYTVTAPRPEPGPTESEARILITRPRSSVSNWSSVSSKRGEFLGRMSYYQFLKNNLSPRKVSQLCIQMSVCLYSVWIYSLTVSQENRLFVDMNERGKLNEFGRTWKKVTKAYFKGIF